jgi:hypothetical protein
MHNTSTTVEEIDIVHNNYLGLESSTDHSVYVNAIAFESVKLFGVEISPGVMEVDDLSVTGAIK